jgi:DNA-binding response OmpR family regulator
VSAGPTVLVVDDDAAFVAAVRDRLDERGCRVQLAETAAAGLALATAARPDLILLSADLPDNVGLSICSKLKRNVLLRDVLVVAVSRDCPDDFFEQHRKLRSHADDYVRKPIAMDALLVRLGALITLPAGGGPEREEVVRIDEAGAARPLGATATERMRARQGDFQVMPSPPDLVLLRRAAAASSTGSGPAVRRCRLSGEITAPGSLCDIVGLLGYARWRGELLVLDGASTRSLFFEPDFVVSAQSSVDKERLGEVLYGYGALTRDQVAAASLHSAQAGLRFAEAVASLGFMPQDELFRLMGKQTEEVFHGALRAEAGMFYFLDGYDEAQLSYRHRLPLVGLITETVRRIDETQYFREKVPSSEHVPERVLGRNPPSPGAGALLARVYEAADGLRSVAAIARHVGEGELDVVRALFQMVQSGLLRVTAPRTSSSHAIVEVFNRAIALILRELDAIDEGDGVRAALKTFAHGHPLYPTLLCDCGPNDDGTLDADRVTANLSRLSQPDAAGDMLSDALYEYASYAMFLARPHLGRREAAEAADGPVSSWEPRHPPKPVPPKKPRFSGTIAAVLAPIAPGAKKKKG